MIAVYEEMCGRVYVRLDSGGIQVLSAAKNKSARGVFTLNRILRERGCMSG